MALEEANLPDLGDHQEAKLNNVLGIVAAQGYMANLPKGIRTLSKGARTNYLLGMVEAKQLLHSVEYAILKDNVKALQEQFSFGVNPDTVLPKHHETLLEFAFRSKSYAVAEALLRKGADVNKIAGTISPLMMAVRDGQLKYVHLVLKYGADVSFVNRFGESALLFAVKAGNSQLIDLLLEKGAGSTVNQMASHMKSELPLIIAVVNGCLPCVVSLIRGGADVNKKSYAYPENGLILSGYNTALTFCSRLLEHYRQRLHLGRGENAEALAEIRDNIKLYKEMLLILDEAGATEGGGRRRRKTRSKRRVRRGRTRKN
jgi:ankyrin repeat protein